ncbi:hypothetical protein BH20ACT15_BH20ACT15_15050 [soil metagenome]
MRNVAIIMGLALVVAVVPGGGNAADTILLALQIGFLAVIAWAVYRYYDSQQMTVATIPDGRRAVLFGSVGAIALLIAGFEQFEGWTGGVVVWLLLMFTAVSLIFIIWREAITYS